MKKEVKEAVKEIKTVTQVSGHLVPDQSPSTQGAIAIPAGTSVMDILNKQAETAEYEPGFLTFKTNHGSRSFDAGVYGTVNAPISCVILSAKRIRTLWAFGSKEDESKIKEWSGKRPLCISDGNGGSKGDFPKPLDNKASDLVKMALAPPLEAGYTCSKCKWNEFGTDGKGKACKEIRRLLLYLYGQDMVAVLPVTPSSLVNWRDFVISMPEKRYDLCLTQINADPVTTDDGSFSVLRFEPLKEKGTIVPVTGEIISSLGKPVQYGGRSCLELEALLAEFGQLEISEENDYPKNGNAPEDSEDAGVPFEDGDKDF